MNLSTVVLNMESLLIGTCEALQISPDMQKEAEDYYYEVAEFLSEDPFLAEAHRSSYPQGSLRMAVTVHPYKRNEFDLDFVFEMNLDWNIYNAKWVLETIENRLRQNPEYARILDDTKNTCSRLNHNHRFHTDIVPGLRLDETSTTIRVPHREKDDYLVSDPEGLAKWLDRQSVILIQKRYLIADASAGPIEPLPEKETVLQKPPIKKAIQLLKRNRDIFFYGSPLARTPAGVLLCVLAGHHYGGEVSVYDAVWTIVTGIIAKLDDYEETGVPNPVNPDENLARAWKDEEAFRKFKTWIIGFLEKWQKLDLATDREKINLLTELFGETPREVYAKILDKYASEDLAVERETRIVKPKKYATGPAVISQAHNFYGG